MSVLADPTGAVFSMWEPRNSIGAEIVNVPGALTWNELATTDVERAKEFYGELFGWRLEDMEGGPMQYAMIYNGDRSNGGIRPLSEMEAGIPPNWVPYFAAEAVDAAVAKAGELGGRVLVQPVDGAGRHASRRSATPRAPCSPCSRATSTTDARAGRSTNAPAARPSPPPARSPGAGRSRAPCRR